MGSLGGCEMPPSSIGGYGHFIKVLFLSLSDPFVPHLYTRPSGYGSFFQHVTPVTCRICRTSRTSHLSLNAKLLHVKFRLFVYQVLREKFFNVKFPKHSTFSKCSVCTDLKNAKEAAKTPEEKGSTLSTSEKWMKGNLFCS